jgi:hypothetical protein
MSRLTKAIILLSAILLLTAGCSKENSVLNSEGTQNLTAVDPVFKIPGGTQLDSARLLLTVSIINSQPVAVHQITAEWTEGEVTWSNFNNSYSQDTAASFIPSNYGQVAVDITDLAQGWINGTIPNYGVLLRQGASLSQFRSKEYSDPAARPKLELYLSSSGVPNILTVQDSTGVEVEDAFIGGNFPDGNNGDAPLLMVGNTFGSEQSAMVKFVMVIVAPANISIGDFVWDDLNFNGIQDAGEPGMANVTVNLYDCADNLLASAVTDGSGFYMFSDLEPGDYSLEFVAPAGYVLSPYDQGADDMMDSDADPLTGKTPCFTLDADGEYLSYDAGMYVPENGDGGCTHSVSYWRNQIHWGGQQLGEDGVSQYLPIWLGTADGDNSVMVEDPETAAKILWMKRLGLWFNSFSGIYAELLAAKLNIASGADDADIIVVINAVDIFLASHDPGNSKRLSWMERRNFELWKKKLKEYNMGFIGPGSCNNVEPDE